MWKSINQYCINDNRNHEAPWQCLALAFVLIGQTNLAQARYYCKAVLRALKGINKQLPKKQEW